MSSMQWPTLPNPAGPADNFTNPAEARFVVLIEEIIGSGETQRWGIDDKTLLPMTRDVARESALALTRSYKPRHPLFEQSREVYRLSPDEYLVLIAGATSKFHIRLNVVERL